MAREDLRPFNTLTEEEHKAIARKGGIASGESRRQRKAFKEAFLLALEAKTKDGKSVQDVGVQALIDKFLCGDLEVFKAIRDTIGEKPVDKQINVETDFEKYIKATEDKDEF